MSEGPFFYSGRVDSLARQVETHQEKINRKYMELLGEERYEKLRGLSRRFLTPESHFDSLDAMQNVFGVSPAKESKCSSFLIATPDLQPVFPDGRIRETELDLATGIYVSEDSFKNSGSSKYTGNIIATYVHEFNHFVWAVLQRVPIYLTELYLTQEKGKVRSIESLRNLVESLEIDARPPAQKMEALSRGLAGTILNISFEKANELLDNLVLGSIGINSPLTWRGQEKKYAFFQFRPIPDKLIPVIFPYDGDLFEGMNDKKVIDTFINWQDTPLLSFNSPLGTSRRTIESIKSLKINHLSLTEFLKKHKEESK